MQYKLRSKCSYARLRRFLTILVHDHHAVSYDQMLWQVTEAIVLVAARSKLIDGIGSARAD